MIPVERLDRIAELLQEAGLNDRTVADLRSAFADLHFTRCCDDDVVCAEPFRSRPGFNLYLVDGRGPCLVLTKDPANATGVVLAEVEDQGEP